MKRMHTKKQIADIADSEIETKGGSHLYKHEIVLSTYPTYQAATMDIEAGTLTYGDAYTPTTAYKTITIWNLSPDKIDDSTKLDGSKPLRGSIVISTRAYTMLEPRIYLNKQNTGMIFLVIKSWNSATFTDTVTRVS